MFLQALGFSLAGRVGQHRVNPQLRSGPWGVQGPDIGSDLRSMPLKKPDAMGTSAASVLHRCCIGAAWRPLCGGEPFRPRLSQQWDRFRAGAVGGYRHPPLVCCARSRADRGDSPLRTHSRWLIPPTGVAPGASRSAGRRR
jgi:hypothetical protein